MELAHHYGPNVHVLDDAYLLSVLARIGSPETGLHEMPGLMRSAYRRLMGEFLRREFPVVRDRVTTRMHATEPRGVYEGPRLCQQTGLAIATIIRGGVLPAQTCYELAGEVLPSDHVRLDFLDLSRETDRDGQVTGVRLDGSKIGGSVDDAIVLIPDPMGATGGTVARTVAAYREGGGSPRACVALHLMVTPEAILHLKEHCPDTIVIAGRLDRGLSPREILDTVPGTHPERERGLNDVQYIVPGAGGIGEILTNSWV
jgi:uracil phosphoribosyltransferase